MCLHTTLYEDWIAHLDRELRERALLLMRYGSESGEFVEDERREEKPDTSRSELDEDKIKGMVSFLPDYILLEIQWSWIAQGNGYSPANQIVIDNAKEEAKKRKVEPTLDLYKQQIFFLNKLFS